MTMGFAYLACPLSPADGETVESNLARAKTIYRMLCLEYPAVVFLAQWITNCEVFEDTPEFRAAGMARNKAIITQLLPRVRGQFWMRGPRISGGMRDEAIWAAEVGIQIDNGTPDGFMYGNRFYGPRPGIVNWTNRLIP